MLVAQKMVEHESSLSDALLRQLIAVGQVDILVGLPTLNNAATIVDIVRAVNVCFTRDFPRLRTVMINSDGGSTDGTPELIRAASFTEADMVQTSHSLRTLHRVVAPYHGLPGKHTALRTVFAAGELTQAKVLVGHRSRRPGDHRRAGDRADRSDRPLPGRVPGAALSAASSRRRPRSRSSCARWCAPVYGVALDEPLGAEFACSGRFAAHSLEQDIWDQEAARFAIDLWLRTGAVAERFTVGQIWRPATTAAGAGTTLREAVHQVVLALIESLRAHESFWLKADGSEELPTFGTDPIVMPDAATWDYQSLAEHARHDIVEIKPLLEEVLGPDVFARVMDDSAGASPRLDDELWVRIVYAFAAATRLGRASIDQLADMFAPLYMWRASAFMSHTALESPAIVQARLDSLCETFKRLKPELVANWSDQV